jgi:uncharacterized protein
MIALDTNILVYAHRAESAFHVAAYASVQSLAEGAQPWGLPVACIHEFLSIATNPKIFNPASTYEQALAQVDAWLASPTAYVLHSGGQHWEVLADLTRKAKLQGGQFHAARVAALCIENSVSVLWTADRDFGRFKALKTVNPLV